MPRACSGTHTWTVGTPHTSAAFSATLRVHLENRPGAFARMAAAIGEAGGLLDAIDLVRLEHGKKVRDVTVLAVDEAHIARITEAVRAQDGIEVEHISDRTLLLHRGGKLEIGSKVPLKTRDDLSMAYTPGVARVCREIADDPERVWNLTMKENAVAVVTDGTAVLGLGDIGPQAALPVMEGKAILFKEFAGIDAWPICLATTDPDEIVRTVVAIAPGFGGINLEDIAAPRCFEIEARLRELLDIPVVHDDQHGTAIVVLAALQNALRVVGKRLEDVRIVVTGAGAAGSATARMLATAGAGEIICSDKLGVLYPGRPDLDRFSAALAAETNPRLLRGSADEALASADVYIGLSGAGRGQHRRHPLDGRGRDRLRDGESDAGDRTRGDRGPRRGDGNGQVRLPESDQQRACVPRPLPRRARRPGDLGDRGHEDRRCASARRRRPSRPSRGRLRAPERARSRRRARDRSRRGARRGRRRRGADPARRAGHRRRYRYLTPRPPQAVIGL